MDDDALMRLYNQELIALSGQADLPKRLPAPGLFAKAVSPICGSEVTIEIAVDKGRVTAFGYEVEACALTKSVVAVMAQAILGKTRADIARAAAEFQAMLEGKPTRPSGDWAALEILEPVIEYKARHNAMMLPFEAIEKAFSKNS